MTGNTHALGSTWTQSAATISKKAGNQNAKKYDNPSSPLERHRENVAKRQRDIKAGVYVPKFRKSNRKSNTRWTGREEIALVEAVKQHGTNFVFIAGNVEVLQRFDNKQLKSKYHNLEIYGRRGLKKKSTHK